MDFSVQCKLIFNNSFYFSKAVDDFSRLLIRCWSEYFLCYQLLLFYETFVASHTCTLCSLFGIVVTVLLSVTIFTVFATDASFVSMTSQRY